MNPDKTDISVFDDFFRKHYSRLVFFARQLLQQAPESEDIVQDVFIKYWKQQAHFANETAARAFLYVAVRNACFNHLKHQKTRRKYQEEHPVNEAVEEGFVLQSITLAETLSEVYRAIELLPEGCRTVFKLGYFDELSNQQIADQLRVSINTVKTQKARALQLLRLRLNPGQLTLLALLLARHTLY